MMRHNGHSGLVGSTLTPADRNDAVFFALAGAGAVMIFAIDVLVPKGIAVPIGYVALLLMGLGVQTRWFTTSVAATGIVLTVIGYLLSTGGIVGLALVNRCLVIVVIAATAYLILLTQHARQEIHTLREFMPRCASCRKIKDETGNWRELEQFLEERTNVLFSHGLCPLCVEKWYPELYPELQIRHPELFQSQPN